MSPSQASSLLEKARERRSKKYERRVQIVALSCTSFIHHTDGGSMHEEIGKLVISYGARVVDGQTTFYVTRQRHVTRNVENVKAAINQHADHAKPIYIAPT
jgi:hypothetical protein